MIQKLMTLLISGAIAFIVPYRAYCSDELSLTNPLLKSMRFKEIHPFVNIITDYMDKEKAGGSVEDAAFYFRSLSDGIWSGINEKNQFSAASLTKVPIMMAYYKLAEKKPEILKEKYKYEILINETRNFLPKQMPVVGKYYSIDELIRIMIQQSDNNAAAILIAHIDEKYLLKVLYIVGIYHGDEKFIGNNVSIKNLVSMFRVLYNASFLNAEMSEKALRNMVGTEFVSGIVAGIPKDIAVSHKFGEQKYAESGIVELHECAIVYYKNNPYLLGVMSKGKDFGKLCEFLKAVSKLVYEQVDTQYSSTDDEKVFEQ
jgi:beta-lactamase class A